MQIVIQNYGVSESNVPQLKAQFLFLPETAKFCSLDSKMQFSKIIALFKKLDTIKRILVAEVSKLVKLLLIMPTKNAVSERSFSFFKRIKTCLSSTTTNTW